MSGRPQSAALIAAIVCKDLREFSRDRLWMILTPLSMGFIITIFWLLPDRVDETLRIGLHPPELAEAFAAVGARGAAGARGLEVVGFPDEKRLAAAVAGELDEGAGGDIAIGLSFPDDFADAARSGERPTVSLHVAVAVPAELRRAVASVVRELAYGLRAAASGGDPASAFPVAMPDPRQIILGTDQSGARVPLREKLRPMMVVLILLFEALALAGLVAVEIEQRTATALLVTPVRTADFLAAKATTGAVLGVTQGVLFMLATASFGKQWLLVATLLLLGAVMMSAVGMLAGAAGKDFMSTLFYSVAFLVPLMIPALALLFPGSTSLWIQLLPSHGLVQAMVGALGKGQGWVELAPYFGMILAWNLALFLGALLVLKRKVETL